MSIKQEDCPFWVSLLFLFYRGFLFICDSPNVRCAPEMRSSDVVISVSDDRTDDCPSLMLLELLEQMNIPTAFTDAVITGHGSPDHHEAVRYKISRCGVEKSYVKL